MHVDGDVLYVDEFFRRFSDDRFGVVRGDVNVLVMGDWKAPGDNVGSDEVFVYSGVDYIGDVTIDVRGDAIFEDVFSSIAYEDGASSFKGNMRLMYLCWLRTLVIQPASSAHDPVLLQQRWRRPHDCWVRGLPAPRCR